MSEVAMHGFTEEERARIEESIRGKYFIAVAD